MNKFFIKFFLGIFAFRSAFTSALITIRNFFPIVNMNSPRLSLQH